MTTKFKADFPEAITIFIVTKQYQLFNIDNENMVFKTRIFYNKNKIVGIWVYFL